LLYLGKAQDQSLRKRVASYLYEPKKAKARIHIVEMLEKFQTHLWIYYTVVADASKIADLEDRLLETFIPPYNREFPATISEAHKAAFS
jgi:excinuclease UvrABC nuclease subunit